MDVSASAAIGLAQAADGFEKAVNKLSSRPNPVDSAGLSSQAAEISQHHIAYSLAVKSMKIDDEIADLATDVIG
jgi:hypothetical protein